MDFLQSHQLQGNKILQSLFCSQIPVSDQNPPIPTKKLSIIGYIGQAQHPTLPFFSKAFEISLIGSATFPVTVNSSLPASTTYQESDLLQITKLKIHFQPNLPVQFTLSTTKSSKILKIFADNPIKTQIVLKNPQNPSYSSTLRPLLIMNLSSFAINSEISLKFSLKSLQSISEKVHFTGILLKSEQFDNNICCTRKLIVRDLKTNDQITVYAHYGFSDFESKAFIASFAVCDTLNVSASRMISSKLNIFCKLYLEPPFNNLTLIKHNLPCLSPSCHCLNLHHISLKYLDYTLISSIKQSTLFRATLKIHIRILYLNCLIFKEMCENCGNGRYKSKTPCCQNPKLDINAIGSCIVEDSSGIAECDVGFYNNLQKLLCLDEDCIGELKLIAEKRQDCIVRYHEFPFSLKDKLRNLPSFFRFCVGKVDISCKGDELVRLNANREGIDLSLRILKVF